MQTNLIVRGTAPLGTLLLVLLATAFSARVLATQVIDVRLWRAPDHTRVVFDLSGKTEHRVLQLENPARVVVDMDDTSLEGLLTDLPLANTPVARVRSGIRKGTDLRIVFDLNAKVSPKIFALAPNERTGHRLVLDLFDDQALVEQKPSGGQGPITTKSVEELGGRRDIIVAIDAGHGGEDPGASGPKKLREKEVVLKIARKLESRLAQTAGFKPVMIRDGDYYVSLRGRRELARKAQADLFVSIHADAFDQASANGASVYALSTRGATSTAAQYLADRENAADLVGGVRLSDKDDVLAGVLTDLSMTATLDTSLSLGREVLKEVDKIAKLHKRKVEQAGFAVLKSPDIPSILVETGFISNPGEAQRLATASYQDKMARAIQVGIEAWFFTHPPAGTLLAWRRTQQTREYVIVSGDTLSEIADRNGVSLRALKATNGLTSNTIRVGQTLIIPDA